MVDKYIVSAVKHNDSNFSISVFNKEKNSFETFENFKEEGSFNIRLLELVEKYDVTPIKNYEID